jgi:hypothetical protein
MELGRKQSSLPCFGSLVGASQNCYGRTEMPMSKTFRASWSIGLAAALLAAVPPGRSARAENIVGDGRLAAHVLDAAASEGTFRHLRALQDIASVSGGNRAAGSPGYDRSAEYVAERLKEAGYVVQLEEFEFPFSSNVCRRSCL